MLGAIFGDIIGSRFEFDMGGKTKEFTLFTNDDGFTDDTAMTVAVADGLMKAGKDACVEDIHKAMVSSMRAWANEYPNAGYGSRFYRWLFSGRKPAPYGSYGNGSAMRVAAAGWLYDSLERTREVAKATAEVTHNHPEGIKGAECTAAVIYLSRTGATRDEIKDYVVREFGYDVSRTVDELRPLHEHVESCQDSLPKALVSFFEGTSYEDVVRNAVSLGGDTDTLGAIAGSMAEAFFGIPADIIAQGKKYLPEDMLQVVDAFYQAIGRDKVTDTADYSLNACIRDAVSVYRRTGSESDCITVLEQLIGRMMAEGEAPVPMVDVNHVLDSAAPGSLNIGEELTLGEELRLAPDTMRDTEGNEWMPLFTDEAELNRGVTANIRVNLPIRTILETALQSEKVQGLVINPFGESLQIPKPVLEAVLKLYGKTASGGNAGQA